MKNLKRYIISFLFILTITQLKAQDSQFSQFYSSPLNLSPSLAGATDYSRLIANYRNQWANLPDAYTTYSFSFDHFLTNYNSGLGVVVLRDQEGGVYNTTTAGIAYSYVIEVNHKIKVRPGLKAAYYNRSVQYSNLDFADELYLGESTSIEIPKNEQVNHYDFAFSLLTYTDNYWIGATGDHLLALNKQFSDDDTYPSLKVALYGGVKLKLYEKYRAKTDKFISLSFLYKNQAGFNQLDVGVNYEKEPFRIGIWFRGIPAFEQSADLNAVVLLVGTTVKDILINYSYDISTSRLLASTGGAHEISIAYRLDLRKNKRKYKIGAVPCPYF
ncbi:MAG: type IX secretion system membrane protein PorP/SprF [Bacteroidales bacterium]|nr:type IX secretion system membrane protein PorP/SprF [Bacteroidales bacterium]